MCLIKRDKFYNTSDIIGIQDGAVAEQFRQQLARVAEAEQNSLRQRVILGAMLIKWERFLGERTIVDGRPQYKHERLRKARRGLERLQQAEVVNYSLSNLDALVEVAADEGYIAPEQKKSIIEFRNSL